MFSDHAPFIAAKESDMLHDPMGHTCHSSTYRTGDYDVNGFLSGRVVKRLQTSGKSLNVSTTMPEQWIGLPMHSCRCNFQRDFVS